MVACQAPLSMGFSRHEYWRWLLFPSPGDFPNAGIKPESPAVAGGFFIVSESPRKPINSSDPLNKPRKLNSSINPVLQMKNLRN